MAGSGFRLSGNEVGMVNRLLIYGMAALTLSSCSPSSWWGESPNPAGIVTQGASGKSCPSPSGFLTGDRREAQTVLDCWRGELSKIWTDVRGFTVNSLSDGELEILLQQGVVKDPDPDLLYDRLLALKRLLGMQGKLDRRNVEDWFEWLEENQERIRIAYNTKYQRFQNISDVVDTVVSFLRRIDVTIDTDELAELVRLFLSPESAFSRAAFEIFEVAHGLIKATCPQQELKNAWHTQSLAQCLYDLKSYLYPGEEWVDYLLNEELSLERVEVTVDSVNVTAGLLRKWFRNPSLSKISTRPWIRLAQRLEVQVTDSSLNSIRWISRFVPDSDEYFISPMAVPEFFEVYRNYLTMVFDGYRPFRICSYGDAKKWKDCIPTLNEEQIRSSESLRVAISVKNPSYGQKVRPLNGRVYDRLMLLHAVSGKMVQVFDEDGDGLVSLEKQTSGELYDLISFGLEIEKNAAFFATLWQTIKGKGDDQEDEPKPDGPLGTPVEDPEIPIFYSYDRAGLAEVVALMGESMTIRTRKAWSLWEEVRDHLSINPSTEVQLDQEALTSVLGLIDSLASFNAAYLNIELTPLRSREPIELIEDEKEPGEYLIPRHKFMDSVPDMLYAHFPRIFYSCMEFGYERTCGPMIDELIPGESGSDELVHISNLHVITLSMAAAEAFLDRCDYDGNGRLSQAILDGNDELDCLVTRIRDSALRLMNARIVESTGWAKTLLDLVNLIGPTRLIGKIALIRGTTKHLWLHAPLHPVKLWRRDTTMGRTIGLLSEVIAPDEVELWKERKPEFDDWRRRLEAQGEMPRNR